MSKFYVLSVKEIYSETHNAVSVSFHIPDSLKEIFRFIPGQYITIQKQLNGAQVRRDYSICSAQNSGILKIGIKAVEKGLFSQYATKDLKVGDELEVSEPRGRFKLEPNISNRNSYLAFTAGSGITPVLSMISSALETETQSKFVLVYGNKTVKDVMFKQDLDSLKEQYPDRFFVHYVFSQVNEGAYHGRISEAIVNKILKELYKDFVFDSYYLCGPEPMINLVKATLLENSIDKDKIHFELFTVATEGNDEEAKVQETLEGETAITVLLDEEEEAFVMKNEHTILDAVLLQGLDAPYSCQGGICSSCIAKVTEGKAIMEKNTILDAAEVEEGLILTCQAHPVTKKIAIDYDDV